MDLSSNTVLVTGGASGIGLALAVRFQKSGSSVIICGRRADKLAEAKRPIPRCILTSLMSAQPPAARISPSGPSATSPPSTSSSTTPASSAG